MKYLAGVDREHWLRLPEQRSLVENRGGICSGLEWVASD